MNDDTMLEAIEEDEDSVRGGTWDLYVLRWVRGEPQQRLVATLPELVEAIGTYEPKETVEEQRALVRRFMGLRAAKAMPDTLRDEVKEFLR